MKNHDVKLKISILWLAFVLANLAQIVLSFMNTNFLSNLINNSMIGPLEINSFQILIFSFVLLIPLILAPLTLVMRNERTNKYLNLIFSIILLILGVGDMIGQGLAPGILIISSALGNLFALIIVYYSWKWK